MLKPVVQHIIKSRSFNFYPYYQVSNYLPNEDFFFFFEIDFLTYFLSHRKLGGLYRGPIIASHGLARGSLKETESQKHTSFHLPLSGTCKPSSDKRINYVVCFTTCCKTFLLKMHSKISTSERLVIFATTASRHKCFSNVRTIFLLYTSFSSFYSKLVRFDQMSF